MLLSKLTNRFQADAVALMYHAVAGGKGLDGTDPYYTLPLADFRKQLDAIQAQAGGATSVRDWLAGGRERVLLTFDDGHDSDRWLALPMLQERGMRADFFINPANVGRAGYARWPELRELAAAGMSIQSHGYDHRFLTQQSPTRLRESLRAARLEIEVRIGSPVSLLAPPGGRVPPDLLAIARDCGYSHVMGSQPGWLKRGKVEGLLPRVAITVDVGEPEFGRWIRRQPGSMLRPLGRYRTLAVAKSMLGDERYERVRERALGHRDGRA